MKIKLPIKKGSPNTKPEIDFEKLVIIGANGSGKTRFGAYIEYQNSITTHRVSAQKILSFPESVSPKSKEIAEQEFIYGYYRSNLEDLHKTQMKFINRWKQKINTHTLNDFTQLLILLHTEEYEESLNYKEGRTQEKPKTKLDIVQSIWEEVLPHRKLLKRAGIIETIPTEQKHTKYNASEMSDGERVIFYLIGQVICTPRNSLIIIDEPEMHIHKSLIKRLFDLIEDERQDCAFVYLTHNVDFAISRQNSKKIWAKSYEGNNVWDYEILNYVSDLPEDLYLELLGSRKPVIFLEGNDSTSIDYHLFQRISSKKG